MKTGLVPVCLLIVSLPLFAQTATAQKPDFYWIHEEVAKPGMIAQYESAVLDILGTLTAQKADPKTFGMNVYMTADAHYFYVVPIPGYSYLETFWQTFTAVGEAGGKAKWADIQTRGNSATISTNEMVAIRRHDLEYAPASPRLKPDEVNFVHLLYFYPEAAHTDDLEQVGRDYAAFFKSKNVGDPFRVYQVVTGADLPLYIVAIPAKSASDYYSEDEKTNTALGADLRPLQARSLANLRKFETKDVMFRADMSYPPPAKK